MTSLCRHLSPTAQEIVNWVTTALQRVRSHRRRDSTRQLSRVGVGGVYWALSDCNGIESEKLRSPSQLNSTQLNSTQLNSTGKGVSTSSKHFLQLS